MKKLIITAAIVASIGGLAACASHPVAAAAPAPTVTKTVISTPTPTPTVTETVVPAPIKTVYVAPAAQPVPALTDCGNNGSAEVYAGADTSCPFALNVAEAYSLNAGFTNAFNVYSPVTGLSYIMTCTVAGNPIVCTGGNSALVELNT
jgi:hypothetical protein